MLKLPRAGACVVAFGFLAATGASASEPVFIAVDDASTASLGPMPLDRAVYARAIDAATNLGAKAIVLKFFFDAPRSSESDSRLAMAIRGAHVLMQVEEARGSGRSPAAPFVRDDWRFDGIQSPYELGNVHPPLANFERGAAGLGFVSVRPGFEQAVEIVARWQGKAVPSLQIRTVELALGGAARVERGEILMGTRHVKLDEQGRVPCDVMQAAVLPRYPIDRLLDGSIPRDAIEGRIVVLGYDRKDSPRVELGPAKVKVHDAFNRQVSCLFQALGS